MSTFPVSLEKEAQLLRRMTALDVRESDIEESLPSAPADTAVRTSTRLQRA